MQRNSINTAPTDTDLVSHRHVCFNLPVARRAAHRLDYMRRWNEKSEEFGRKSPNHFLNQIKNVIHYSVHGQCQSSFYGHSYVPTQSRVDQSISRHETIGLPWIWTPLNSLESRSRFESFRRILTHLECPTNFQMFDWPSLIFGGEFAHADGVFLSFLYGGSVPTLSAGAQTWNAKNEVRPQTNYKSMKSSSISIYNTKSFPMNFVDIRKNTSSHFYGWAIDDVYQVERLCFWKFHIFRWRCTPICVRIHTDGCLIRFFSDLCGLIFSLSEHKEFQLWFNKSQ